MNRNNIQSRKYYGKRKKNMKKRNEIKIKGIIFDLGGVLIESFGSAFLKNASQKIGATKNKLGKLVQTEEQFLERGEETSIEFWKRICKKLKIQCPSDRTLASLWVKPYKAHAKLKQDTISLVKKLQGKYKLAALSNTMKEHNLINRKRKLFNYFDVLLLSNELGMRKPERRFFELASKKLQIPFQNLLFIDDDMRWVRVARKYGLQAILFKSADRLEASLRRLGIHIS